jgi:sulfur carrier protein ThiS
MRSIVCSLLALLLFAGLGLAADKNAKKKKGAVVAGTVKSVDASTGKLTVAVKVKKSTEEKEFSVGDAVKIVTFVDGGKQEASGKDGLKNIKSGEKIRVLTDDGGKVVSLQIGQPPKKKKPQK